jgi:hypothetical protein
MMTDPSDPNIRRILLHHESQFQRVGKTIAQHAKLLNDHSRFIANQTADAMLRAEKEILSHFIERSKFYFQAILAIGYAAFFGFWAFMKDKTDDFVFAIAGLSMATSLAIFIFYTVWDHLAISRLIAERTKEILAIGNDPSRYLDVKNRHDERIKDWTSRQFRRWNAVIILTLLPAVIAIFALFYAFIAFLISSTNWAAKIVWVQGLFSR